MSFAYFPLYDLAEKLFPIENPEVELDVTIHAEARLRADMIDCSTVIAGSMIFPLTLL